MQLTDRDILTDILMDIKHISSGYHMAVLEAANDRIRNTLIHLNNEELATQKQIFDLMYSRGWYQVEPAHMAPGMAPGIGVPTPGPATEFRMGGPGPEHRAF